MFCPYCADYKDRGVMKKCEECNMYFCTDDECYLEHVTDPEHHTPYKKQEAPAKRLPRIRRKKTKKQVKNAKVDLCDDCHQEFCVKDLIYGPEPFRHEVYDDVLQCKLCKHCHHESCMDV